MDGPPPSHPKKSKSTPKWRHQQVSHRKQQEEQRRSGMNDHNQQLDRQDIDLSNHDPEGIETRRPKGSQAPRTFSQPSVISNGDKGIFVTTDIGREKKGLIEISGLVEEFLEEHGLIDDKSSLQPASLSTGEAPDDGQNMDATAGNMNTIANTDDESDMDIEASIARELSNLNSASSHDHGNGTLSNQAPRPPPKPFQLITLDIPCVSFLRFHPRYPTYPRIDPVLVTHSLCDTAMNTATMRSRFIRRLSPITWLGKTLAGGLEKCCQNVLPPHFQLRQTASSPLTDLGTTHNQASTIALQASSFAIRPSIRNNDKLSRDEVIKYIAEQVMSLGQGQHKVDLKNYQQGILVEVYRGWIGMSVVSNTSNERCPLQPPLQPPPQSSSLPSSTIPTSQQHLPSNRNFKHSYEQLKRFNLAEIYSIATSKQAK